MPRDPEPALSIVIPSYNGKHLLATGLTSIDWCAPRHLPIEIIVVDDASTDGTAGWLLEHYPWVRVERLEANGGFCRAANLGIAAARGAVIQLLNNDTEVASGWVEAGLRPFADPCVGSVAPLVLRRNDPERVDSAGDGYWVFGLPFKRGSGECAQKWANTPSGAVFGASGSSAFYRASILKKLGGFDPAFGSYYEDVDLAFRLRRAGFTCVYAPDCKILHDVSATYDHRNPDLQRRLSRNAELIFWRRLPPSWVALAALPHFGFLCAQAAQRLATGRLRPFLHGKYEAFKVLLNRKPAQPRGPHQRRSLKSPFRSMR